MINFDGNCFSGFKSVPEEFLCLLAAALPIHTHYFTTFHGKIVLLEAQYFSLMAALRRTRVEIPMHYTLTFFQEQMDHLNDFNNAIAQDQKLVVKFYSNHHSTEDSAVTSICFLMQIYQASWEVKNLNLILYKDHYIFANDYSNLMQTNASLRKLGQVFAFENGFGASLLLNNFKRVADTTHGAVFLIYEGEIRTPGLSEGTVNTVLRTALINHLKKESEWKVIEAEIPTFLIQRAHEMFAISSEYGWVQVNQFRKKKFKTLESKSIYLSFLAFLKNQL